MKLKKVKTVKKVAKSKAPIEGKSDVAEENATSHRKQLEDIAKKDPDFYKFLQQEDADLLEFNDSDVDMGEEFDDEDADLEMDEEEPDLNTEDIMVGTKRITLELYEERRVVSVQVAQLLEKIMANPTEHRAQLKQTVSLAVGSFHACVCRVGASLERGDFVVNDDKVFDSVIRTCLKHMNHCLMLLMNPLDEKQKAKKSKVVSGTNFKNFHKHKTMAKNYLAALTQLLVEVGHKEMVVAIVRSVIHIADLLVHFPKTCRQLVKHLVRIWSHQTVEERCVAFLALNRIAATGADMYTFIYKSCYVAYVSASRQVNTALWPKLLFMQKSFAELTFANSAVSYQYVFVYIRQFAIHLRNAKITKRKDVVKSVYNWQFVLGLYLWATVMLRSGKHRNLADAVEWIRELRYPLIQVIVGLINVFPTARYLPLRLHCIHLLLQLQVTCNTYIPTLSIATDLLEDLLTIDSKKPSHAKLQPKTTPVKDMVRLGREMLEDAGYRAMVADEVFETCLEAAYVIRGSVAFSETVRTILPVIRDFIKNCRNLDHKRLFKALDNKLREHAEVSSLTVAAHHVNLKDPNHLYKLEETLASPQMPIAQYHQEWHRTKQMRQDAIRKAEQQGPAPKTKKSKH